MKRLLLLLILIYPLARFCHHQTKGFRTSKITHNVSCIPEQVSEEMPQELRTTCEKPFTYLARGLQSFSFVSEDGTVVLKLFNNRHRRCIQLFNAPILCHFTKEKSAHVQKKWIKTFRSYELAATYLKEESGLLLLHPTACKCCPVVTIIDPLGSPHQIDLSKHAFALQRKAQGSFSFFLQCAQTNNHQLAREGLISLLELMKKKATLGLHDDDPLIRTNIGFIDGKAMQIDLGPFTESAHASDPNIQREEIAKSLQGLRSFMESQTPTLLPLLNEILHLL